MSKPAEYLCQIDSGALPIVDTTWSVTTSTDWFPLISTAGVVSLSEGGTALNTPYAMGMDGLRYQWSVSVSGVLTLSSTALALTSSDAVSALEDASGLIWLLVVGLDGQVRVTTETPLENKYYYPAVVISFTPTAATDKFELYAIKPNTSMHRR